jgi:hypothetical protein
MESNPNGKFILLGFPLYFMQEDQASEFIYTLLDNLEELDSNEETIFKPEIVLNAYPNPFIINHNNRGIINISYNLPSDSEINLSVFNSKGQKIATIFQGYQPAGEYIKSWDAQSYSSSSVSSGVYFYKLTTDKSEAIGKLIIIK